MNGREDVKMDRGIWYGWKRGGVQKWWRKEMLPFTLPLFLLPPQMRCTTSNAHDWRAGGDIFKVTAQQDKGVERKLEC